MEENNKINRRSRPRPYDLRRKVLLKNFFREQMTYIPQACLTSTAQNIDNNFNVEPSNSLDLDEDLRELNDENSSSSSVAEASNSNLSENIGENHFVSDINDSTVNNTNKPTASINSSDCSAHAPKFFKFTSLMNLRSESKKKKIKGIMKAKKLYKTIKSPVRTKSLRTGLDRFFSVRSKTSRESKQDQATDNSSKSLFSLFKSRKEQRREMQADKAKQSISVDVKSLSKNEKSCTSSQSVQTDDTWTRKELSRVQKSNKLLREENRLLSESLSYFMSTNSLESQLNPCGSPLKSSNQNIDALSSSHCYNNNSSYPSYSNDSWNARSRILRSKSVQEHSDRRNMVRNICRTRSMNCHNIQSDFLDNESTSVSTFSAQSGEVSIPRLRRKNILASLPVNNTIRVLQRRSSMPGRTLSENDRSRICCQSSRGQTGSSRTPFHSLPSEAFY